MKTIFNIWKWNFNILITIDFLMIENEYLISRNKNSYLLLEINFLIFKHDFFIFEIFFSVLSTHF